MVIITKSLTTKKVFNYSKDKVSLNFELIEDIKQIKDFNSLLHEAIIDINKLLKSKN